MIEIDIQREKIKERQKKYEWKFVFPMVLKNTKAWKSHYHSQSLYGVNMLN